MNRRRITKARYACESRYVCDPTQRPASRNICDGRFSHSLDNSRREKRTSYRSVNGWRILDATRRLGGAIDSQFQFPNVDIFYHGPIFPHIQKWNVMGSGQIRQKCSRRKSCHDPIWATAIIVTSHGRPCDGFNVTNSDAKNVPSISRLNKIVALPILDTCAKIKRRRYAEAHPISMEPSSAFRPSVSKCGLNAQGQSIEETSSGRLKQS